MKRWQKVLIVVAAILLIIAGGAFWAMNKAVDKVLDAVSSDVLSSMNSPTPRPADIPGNSTSPAPEVAPGVSIEPTPGKSEVSQPLPTPPASTQTTPGGSVSPITESPSLTQPANTPYEANIGADKAQKAQEEITMKDKLQVTSIFMKRFSAKELDAFMKLASGGLTLEEKVEAKKIVLEKLSEEEYDQLIAIAAKLGLSQGKNYVESNKELLN